MEQKKTLWIIAAVGAFLLVVLGAAGIIYSPAKEPTPTVTTVTPTTNQSNSGWTNNNTADNTTSAQKVNEMIVVSENTSVYGVQTPTNTTPAVSAPVVSTPTETTIDLNALKSELATSNTPAPIQPQNINITVTLPDNDSQALVAQTNTTTVKNIIPAQEDKEEDNTEIVPIVPSAKKETVKKTEPVMEKTSEKIKKPAVKQVTNEKKSEVKQNIAKPVTQYWVQVASYSNKKGAEGARSVLDSNKITSDIFTYEDNKGDVYFRVRVGPYMTKSEAEYWQTRIKKIPYFEKNDSYITSTTK